MYRNASVPDEEIVFHGDLQIKLKSEDEAELNRLVEKYSLVYRGTMGGSHVFGVTKATGVNCIKAANQIREEESVAEASPLALQNLQMFAPAAPVLFPRQWHLDGSLRTSMDLLPDAGVDAPLAWQVTQGNPSIVIAVIDDGFDLTHPALRGTTLAPGIRDFVGGDSDPAPEVGDYHGTPVAGLIVGRGAIRGVAPGCAFLPVRIGFGPSAAQIDMVQVFRYVSARADAVNCSFGLAPSNMGLPQSFRNEIAQLASSGGRRGNGLVMVFAAGNDDSPTFLPASQNVRGIRFASR